MMYRNSQPNAFNPMPPVVVALFAAIGGIEFWLTIGPVLIGGSNAIEWRVETIERFAVNSHLTLWMIENKKYTLDDLARFVSFSFIHGSMLNTAIACALFLAMGKIVGSLFSAISVLVFFVGSAAVGAFIYSLAVPEGGWLFGSITGIYGLIGAYTFMMWITLRVNNAPQGQAFYLIALLMGVQLIFSIIFGDNDSWVADLISFGTGFLLSFLFVPGGFSRVLDMLRKS